MGTASRGLWVGLADTPEQTTHTASTGRSVQQTPVSPPTPAVAQVREEGQAWQGRGAGPSRSVQDPCMVGASFLPAHVTPKGPKPSAGRGDSLKQGPPVTSPCCWLTVDAGGAAHSPSKMRLAVLPSDHSRLRASPGIPFIPKSCLA